MTKTGASDYDLGATLWNQLDLSEGCLYVRVASWDAQNQNREESQPYLLIVSPMIHMLVADEGYLEGGREVTIYGELGG